MQEVGLNLSQRRILLLALSISLVSPGCAKRHILEVSSTVMYDRPRIAKVAHELADLREESGSVVAKVEVIGDPGLEASFDIYPGIVERYPMNESSPGHYLGEFRFPDDLTGGPYTLIARLRHETAGETVWRDPNLMTIPLFMAPP